VAIKPLVSLLNLKDPASLVETLWALNHICDSQEERIAAIVEAGSV
jgi:hypothetical protein